MMEETLVLVKPDGVQRGLIGEVIKRFEQRGFKIAGVKMVRIDRDFAKEHYSGNVGKDFYQVLEDFIVSAPVVAMIVKGANAVEGVRKIVGVTEPKAAVPGSIRGDYAHVSYEYADKKGISIKNIVHSSGNKEEAKKEIDLWFSIEERHDYEIGNESHVF